MKSPVRRRVKRRTTQPITVIKDTNYITKISERKIPRKRYLRTYDVEQDNVSGFLSLYGIICIYIFLIIAIIIGGGGIAMCIFYYNSEENTQNWKIGGIILGVVTCIVSVVLMIITIYKQSRNRPWRYQVQDILLHPENYFSDDSEESSSEDHDDDDQSQDDNSEQNNQTVDTTLTSISNTPHSLLKTVHNDLVYCLGCNHLHATSDECIKPKDTSHNLPPLKRIKPLHTQQDSNSIKKKDKVSNKNKSNTMINRSIKYSLSNETQTDELGNKTDNLILRRLPIRTAKIIAQQPRTKIMIVRVPKVAGELVIQPKEH